MIDETTRERLLHFQALVNRGWKGINVSRAGMPGKSNIVNTKNWVKEETEEQ